MNKKQYKTFLIIFGIITAGLIAVNAIYIYVDWIVIFIIVSAFYVYIRFRISSPLQKFANKFNMLVDYDLDVEEALRLAEIQLENAPTKGTEALVQIYVGMALYYNGRYRDTINILNKVNFPKVNKLYHVLVYAFIGYAAYEVGDLETLENCISTIDGLKNQVNRKYTAFVASYYEILVVIKNINDDPERYKEIIERNFSREDGYISTKLIYNYRMAHYYKTVNDVENMDICLAKVIANGKNHHTAISARKLFKNTCKIEDYVFPEPGTEIETENQEVILEPKQIETLEEVEIVDEKQETKEPEERDASQPLIDLSKRTVAELKELCKQNGLSGYSKLSKAELIALLEDKLF